MEKQLCFKEWHITHVSMKTQKRCFDLQPIMDILVALPLRTLFSGPIRRSSPLFSDNQKIKRSAKVIQHSQLNLFHPSSVNLLLITAWCSRGCPQLAASCDTLTLCCMMIIFQLHLLWKPRRQRWLVSRLIFKEKDVPSYSGMKEPFIICCPLVSF